MTSTHREPAGRRCIDTKKMSNPICATFYDCVAWVGVKVRVRFRGRVNLALTVPLNLTLTLTQATQSKKVAHNGSLM